MSQDLRPTSLKEITKEQRKKALFDSWKNKDKSDRVWYLEDGDILKEEYSIESFTPEDGAVFFAILPRPESEIFFKEIFIHYNIGPDNNAFLCPNKMFSDNCPICDYLQELKNAGEPEDVYKEYYWTKRYLFWVVNVENKRTVKDGVYIYDAPKTVKNGILDVCVDERTKDIIDISDPTEKVNIVFRRVGKKGDMRTNYKGFKLEDRTEEIPDEYFDLPDMNDLLVPPDVDLMRKVLGIEEKLNKESKLDDSFSSRHEKKEERSRFGKRDEVIEEDAILSDDDFSKDELDELETKSR